MSAGAGSGDGRRRLRPRSGFTLVEVLLASAVVSIVARIAIPNVHNVLLKARAAEAVADIKVVELAAHNYWADELIWPADAAPGSAPQELTEYLPEGFSFTKDGFVLDWENWIIPQGLPGDPEATNVLGVSVVPENDGLAGAFRQVLSGATWFVVGDTYTYIVER